MKQSSALWPRLKRILALSEGHRSRIFGSLFLLLVAAAVSLALPLGIRSLLDSALAGQDRHLLDLLAVGLFALFIVRGLLSFFGMYVLQVAGERILAELRQRVYAHMHTLDLRYFSNQRVGDLTSRLTSDVTSIRTAIIDTMASSILQAFQLVGSVVVMVALNWRLSLIVILVAPATTFVARVFGPILSKLARYVQEQVAGTVAVAQETLSAIHVVQAFARAPHETRRYAAAVLSLFDASRRSARLGALFTATTNLIVATASIVIFWYGGVEVLSGRLTAGALVAFLLYSQNISSGLNQLSQAYVALSAAAGASERVFEVLDCRSAIVDAADAVDISPIAGQVELDNVSFAYAANQPVLRSISFRAEAGQTVALVGPSGAGKTTLLNLIPRFYDPTEGRVLIDGHDVRSLRLQPLREQIAMVSQDVFLFGASVKENILYGRLDATDEEIEAAAEAANAHDFIVQFPNGYATEIGERGVKLSGGQRQRISIARALLKDARILILDEATSSVDSASEASIQEAMDRLRAERTTFVIAHRLSTVVKADRILVIDGGTIVEAGSHEQLLARGGLYRQLVDTQFREMALSA